MPKPSFTPEQIAAARRALVNSEDWQKANEAQRKQIMDEFDQATTDHRSWLAKAKDFSTTGAVSPETVLKGAEYLTPGDPLSKYSMSELRDISTGPPKDQVTNVPGAAKGGYGGEIYVDPNTGRLTAKTDPMAVGERSFRAGTSADLAQFVSGMTSPLQILLSMIPGLGKVEGPIGKVARGAGTAASGYYGSKGVYDVGKGIKEGVTTPEGAQDVLSGGAQATAIPDTVREATAMGKSMYGSVFPSTRVVGEPAFMEYIKPKAGDQAKKVRAAYKRLAPELQQSGVQTPDKFTDFTGAKRYAAAEELNREVAKLNPAAGKVPASGMAQAILNSITDNIRTSSPAQARALRDYARRVYTIYGRRPLDLASAEIEVQNLNKLSARFDKSAPEAQAVALGSGDPIVGQKALKEYLQSFIDNRMSGYRELKQRYGDYKELNNAAIARQDEIESKGPQESHRAIEALGSALGVGAGMLIGGHFGQPAAGGMAGGGFGSVATDYLLGRYYAARKLQALQSPEAVLQRALTAPKPPRVPATHPLLPYAAAASTVGDNQ